MPTTRSHSRSCEVLRTAGSMRSLGSSPKLSYAHVRMSAVSDTVENQRVKSSLEPPLKSSCEILTSRSRRWGSSLLMMGMSRQPPPVCCAISSSAFTDMLSSMIFCFAHKTLKHP